MKICLEEALNRVEENIDSIKETITVKLTEAKGCILAEDIYSTIDQPPFNRSPLDGYAINSKDTTGASKDNPIRLKVIEEVFAGSYPTKVGELTYATRIMTGAPIPDGYDCVIKQESTDYGMEEVSIYESLKPYQNYCFKGEDSQKGTLLLQKYMKLNFTHIGILASQGIKEVKVIRKTKVLLITTGDELISIDEPISDGKIYNSNMYIIGERLKDLNIEVEIISNGDDHIELSNIIRKFSQRFDLIITTGGVSVGKKDILHDVLKELNIKPIFWKVNIKPGTPVMMSKYKETPILSLSGNPFGAFVNFELLARPALAKLSRDKEILPIRKEVIIENDYKKSSSSRRFIRAYNENDKVYLPSDKHSSGTVSSLANCNCLIDIEDGNEGLVTKEKVNIILM